MEKNQKDLERLNITNRLKIAINQNLINDLSKVLRNEDIKQGVNSLLEDLRLQSVTEEKIQVLHGEMEEVSTDFIERIKEVYPELSKTEREICLYIKLNLSTKEIASIRKTSANAIRVNKHRIRKKLNIGDETELESFMGSI